MLESFELVLWGSSIFVLFIIFVLVGFARWNYGSLEKLGIPVLKPHFCLGSYPNSHKMVHVLEDIKNRRELGEIYGVYNGRTPQVYISDPHVIRRILTTDFDHFRDHSFHEFSVLHPIFANLLDCLSGGKWKTVRSALTPCFKPVNLKAMRSHVTLLTREYTHDLESTFDDKMEDFNIKKSTVRLILEILMKCFLEIEPSKDLDAANKFIASMKYALVDTLPRATLSETIKSSFPLLRQLEPKVSGDPLSFFVDTFNEVLDAHQESSLGTTAESSTFNPCDIFLEMRSKIGTETYQKLGINEIVVVAQAYEFFAGSLAGLRDTLAHVLNHLSPKPDHQERIFREVIDAQDPSDLPFTTACIDEALRLYPTFFRPERMCGKDWEYNGLRIPAGIQVVIPLWALHRSEEYFKDPETFNPERFLGENKDKVIPFTYLPFGYGPRSCIGKSFAYMVLKALISEFVMRFRIQESSRNANEPKTLAGCTLIQNFQGMSVNLIKRNYFNI